jgi:hypothetical protein
MPYLSPVFHQRPPFEQYVFRYRQNPPRESGPQCHRQPLVQFGASRHSLLKFNAEANFSDGDCDDIYSVLSGCAS